LGEADVGDELRSEIEVTGIAEQQLQPVCEADDESRLGDSGEINLGKTDLGAASVGRGGVGYFGHDPRKYTILKAVGRRSN
jgi:hypothetical protein